MGFSRFTLQLGLRLGLLVIALTGLAYLLVIPGYPVLTALLGVGSVILLLDIFGCVRRTNIELTRFLEAVRYADFGQRFQMPQVGTGFEELGQAFTDVFARIRSERTGQEESLRYLRAFTEHVPVPLLSIYPDGRVALQNNAARRLFGSAGLNRLEDLSVFGNELGTDLVALAPGDRRLVVLEIDDLERRMLVSATEIVTSTGMEKLISVQDIQSEFDGAHLQAWQDLVRVLTHEIMNSITPVASLARTASDLVEDATARLVQFPEAVEELADVRNAVDTVARRADGIMHFVQGYRRLIRLPPPEKKSFPVSDLFVSVHTLVAGDWEDQGIGFASQLEPQSLTLTADREMVEQMLLNLLQNAGQALAGQPQGRVELLGSLNRRGRVVLEVSDNGPGVSPEIADKVFIPFFTTRREGSGVGLALTRQVMLAHGGSVTVGSSASGGARFALTF
jgi:nitrogen fixation/metabolism regulation signal transduction histidine kinase